MAQRFVIEQSDDGKWLAGPESPEPTESAGTAPPGGPATPPSAPAPGAPQGIPPQAAQMLGGAPEAEGGLQPVESLDQAIEVARAYFSSEQAQEADAGPDMMAQSLQKGYAKGKGPAPSMMM